MQRFRRRGQKRAVAPSMQQKLQVLRAESLKQIDREKARKDLKKGARFMAEKFPRFKELLTPQKNPLLAQSAQVSPEILMRPDVKSSKETPKPKKEQRFQTPGSLKRGRAFLQAIRSPAQIHPETLDSPKSNACDKEDLLYTPAPKRHPQGLYCSTYSKSLVHFDYVNTLIKAKTSHSLKNPRTIKSQAYKSLEEAFSVLLSPPKHIDPSIESAKDDEAFATLQWAEHALHGMYMLSNTILQAVEKEIIAKDASIAEQTIAFENVCGVRDSITFTAVEFAHVKKVNLSEDKIRAFLPSFYQFLQEKWQAWSLMLKLKDETELDVSDIFFKNQEDLFALEDQSLESKLEKLDMQLKDQRKQLEHDLQVICGTRSSDMLCYRSLLLNKAMVYLHHIVMEMAALYWDHSKPESVPSTLHQQQEIFDAFYQILNKPCEEYQRSQDTSTQELRILTRQQSIAGKIEFIKSTSSPVKAQTSTPKKQAYKINSFPDHVYNSPGLFPSTPGSGLKTGLALAISPQALTVKKLLSARRSSPLFKPGTSPNYCKPLWRDFFEDEAPSPCQAHKNALH